MYTESIVFVYGMLRLSYLQGPVLVPEAYVTTLQPWLHLI